MSGGKLTTYRSMAEEVVDRVERALGRRVSPCVTAREPLPGGDRSREVRALAESDARLAETLDERCVGAELVYAVREEMAATLADLLIRRTRVAFEMRDHGVSVSDRAARIVGPLLGWDETEIAAQVEVYRREVARIFAID